MLNIALGAILLPVCRKLAGFLRSYRFLYNLIPFDENITSHTYIGRSIAVLAIIHWIGWMVLFQKMKGSNT
jgi:hypothetical protein